MQRQTVASNYKTSIEALTEAASVMVMRARPELGGHGNNWSWVKRASPGNLSFLQLGGKVRLHLSPYGADGTLGNH